MRDFKKLEVWKKSHELTLFVYKNVLPKFPKSEQFDLHSQTKRAAYSIPVNIVEGSGRFTEKDCTFPGYGFRLGTRIRICLPIK